jgi:hypothetical protein
VGKKIRITPQGAGNLGIDIQAQTLVKTGLKGKTSGPHGPAELPGPRVTGQGIGGKFPYLLAHIGEGQGMA